MAKPSKDTTSVTARLPTDFVARLDRMVSAHNEEKPGQTFTRTDALAEVVRLGLQASENPKALDIGIIVLKHIHKLQDPQWVADMKARLEEVTLVDFVANLTPDQLDSLGTVVLDEWRLRARKTPWSLLSPDEKQQLIHRNKVKE